MIVCLPFMTLPPQAPVHVLVIPKAHIGGVDCINGENVTEVACVMEKIPQIASSLGLEKGYRVISNVGEHGCQSVRHLHFHILGGDQLSDKMA